MNNFDAELEAIGVSSDAVRGVMREELSARFAQLEAGISALSRAGNDPAMGNFLMNDPEVAAHFGNLAAVDPEAAGDYLRLKFQESHGGRSGSRSYSAGAPSAPANTDLVGKAAEHYRKTGDPTAYGHARLRQVISDRFLNE